MNKLLILPTVLELTLQKALGKEAMLTLKGIAKLLVDHYMKQNIGCEEHIIEGY